MAERIKLNPVFDRLRGENPPAGEGAHNFLTVSDGTKIFYQYWIPEDRARTVVVCFHGAGGHGQFFALFADVLVKTGAAVFVADYRGHGMSEGPRGDFPSFRRLLDDCHEVVLEARRRLPGLPVFILGESMGGAMAVNYAVEHNSGISGLALFSPALLFRKSIPWPHILFAPYYLLSALIAPKRAVIKMSGNEEMGIRNPLHVEYDKTDPQHIDKITLRYIAQLNKYAGIGYRDCTAKITVPTILFQGGADPAIDPAGAKDFVNRLASSDKEFVLYPDALHTLLTDPAADGIAAKLADWFNRH